MDKLDISQNIVKYRKNNKLTQSDLANYLGVTKAAVSKWENGLSIPDICFLPKLAALFDVTLDELVGYRPFLDKEEISSIYHNLATEFSQQPFDQVYEKCDNLIKKYYSCGSFLLQMSILFMNHFMLSESAEMQINILNYARKLTHRIREIESDNNLIKQSISVEGAILLFLKKPEDIFDLFGEDIVPMMDSLEIQAQGYLMKGEYEKADKVYQIGEYEHLLGLINMAVGNLDIIIQEIAMDDSRKLKGKMIIDRTHKLIDVFDGDNLCPGVIVNFYYKCALFFTLSNDIDRGVEELERFYKIGEKIIASPYLHGDEYFDKLDEWFPTFDLGKDMVRNPKTVHDSLISGLLNPVFKIFEDNSKYIMILREAGVNKC